MQRVLTIKVFKEADASKLPLKRPATSLNWNSSAPAGAWRSVVPCAKAKFVVSTGLNPAATKAFIDALRLSRPGTDLSVPTRNRSHRRLSQSCGGGDHIHVVYIRPYLEPHSKGPILEASLRRPPPMLFRRRAGLHRPSGTSTTPSSKERMASSPCQESRRCNSWVSFHLVSCLGRHARCCSLAEREDGEV